MRKTRRGSILIVAIWTVAFLSALMVNVGVRSGMMVHAARKLTDRTQMNQAAWAALEQGIATLKERLRDGLKPKPAWEIQADTFQVQDENRKVSLNSASSQVLTALVTQVGGGTKTYTAQEIAAAIVDWRDVDDNPEPRGAESSFYASLNPPYPCKNAPFETVEELLLVRGIDFDFYLKFKEFVTVFGDGKVNLNTAASQVLQALGMSSGLSTKISSFQKGPDGKLGTEDDGQFSSVASFPTELNASVPLSQSELSEATSLSGSGLLTVQSSFFQVKAQGRLAGKSQGREVRCIVDSNGHRVAWNEG